MEPSELSEQFTWLVDRFHITDVVNRYFQALDRRAFDFETFQRLFTSDAKVVRPNGTELIGPDEISARHHESFARFEGTQHLLTGHDIHLEGGAAEVRVNLVAMHRREATRPTR